MASVAVGDLIDQYERSFKMLYEEIERFDDEQWLVGISSFQMPAKVAMHVIDCLDYYFAGEAQRDYRWGHRFGGGWWQLSDDELPDRELVLNYAQEIEGRVMRELKGLADEDLVRPFGTEDRYGATMLARLVYALRHTMHHHGELATLSIYHGNEGGSWA